MSGVVLRCQHCGTTQTVPGECEACHEGQVRYFCTNHTPGRWLEGSACGQCNARYGDVAPPAVSREAPTDGTAMPRSTPVSRRRPERYEPKPGRRPVEPLDYGAERPGRLPNPLLELLAAAARASMARRTDAPFPVDTPAVRRRGGCLGRMLLLLMFGIAMIVLVPLLFGAFLGLL